MASSSARLSVFAAAIIVQFLSLPANAAAAPAPAPTKFIAAACKRVADKAFCLKTLSEFPPAVSANGLFPMAEAVLDLGRAHAKKTWVFADGVARKDATKKGVFAKCKNKYKWIVKSFNSSEFRLMPDVIYVGVKSSVDGTSRVAELAGKSRDAASKTLLAMNVRMNKYIDLAVGAMGAVFGYIPTSG